ncbi:RNA-directed DNA polymerase, eukaryota, reverse transcriptase zinc-binding domain protein [Tanacetum coccineum]
MSTNRRTLKRNIRPPKRYEDSVSTTSKRNDNDQESSNDEISKEEDLNKEENEVRGNMGENRHKSGEFDENLKEISNLEEIRRNEENENQENFDTLGNNVIPETSVSDENGVKTKTYANMVKNNDVSINKNLIFIAPKITKGGMVKVLFDEEIVKCGGKFGLKDVIVNASGVNLFKFWNETGMKCRTDYARFLVETEAKIELKEVIKIEYIRKKGSVKGTKEIVVTYDWKPETCAHCNVFGHCFEKFSKRPRTDEEKHATKVAEQIAEKEKFVKQNEGIQEKDVFSEGVNDANKNASQKSKSPATKVTKDTSGRNKFEVLNEMIAEEASELRILKDRMLDIWEIDRLKEQEDQSKNVEDVFVNQDGSEKKELWRDIMRAKRITSAMVNEELILKFPDANALFLPYIVSDHSPVVVRFPFIYEKKKKAFRFANYIANKEDFIPTVAAGWEYEKNGNLSLKVEKCRNELKNAQINLDKYPHNQDLKEKEVKALNDYNEATNDEEKGNLMEEQFVNHFKKFLGAGHVINDLINFEGVFGTKLSNDESMEMIKEIIDSEIKNAIFDIGENKAPEFFTTGKLIGKLNATIISLIPKGYDRKSGPSRCCMKIDITKAYDTVNWRFLEMSLTQKGYFPSGSGLRQGDPMSPCLFTLVMEVFTLLMAKNVQKNQKFKFHTGCKELKLTHLCFADDLLVVCNGDVESVKVIKSTMLEFSGMSGLIPNMEKSTVFFGNVKNETKTKILDILPFTVGKLPVKCLGCNGKSREEKQRLPGKMFAILKVKVKWVNVVKLKGRSIWDIQKESNDSWIWKTLLDLRGKIQRNVMKVLGNGKNTNVWKIWEDLKDRMEKRDLSNSWDALIDQYARSVCNNSIGSILRRILLATVVYNIWKERNTRLFTGEVKDGKTVQIIITESVKLQLLGLKVKKFTNVDKVASNWNVMMNYE